MRYRGRTFVRIEPRRDIATEAEERILMERRTAYMPTFDATPCIGATLNAAAMKVLGYVNMYNRGITQVQSELAANGNPPAHFNTGLITAFAAQVKKRTTTHGHKATTPEGTSPHH